MLEFVESLSLHSRALLVALVSVATLIAAFRILPRWAQWCTGVLVPTLLAWSLYWSPVWLGAAGHSEYSAWSWLGVGAWSAAGLLANSVVAIIAVRFRRRRKFGGA
jgi:hypothetical protein